MSTKQLHYKTLMKEYDQKRMLAEKASQKRHEEVYAKCPDIEKIDRSLREIGVQLIRHMMNNNETHSIESFENRSKELQTLKKMKLVENGFPNDYLEVHYNCPICQDTGYVGSKTCKCFKQALINIAYKESNLIHVLREENFSQFRLDYYSCEVDPKRKISPRKNMERILDLCVSYVEHFDTHKDNLLFEGPTGLGKTFLCNCIAKELLDLGYSVLYLSAEELFRLFSESRFHRDDMPEDAKNILETLFTVDLLIIDDFGTEASNSFTGPDLFNTINTRFLKQKATIISTNIKLKDLKVVYEERILSRIHGNYTILKMFGHDIRLLKKYPALLSAMHTQS